MKRELALLRNNTAHADIKMGRRLRANPPLYESPQLRPASISTNISASSDRSTPSSALHPRRLVRRQQQHDDDCSDSSEDYSPSADEEASTGTRSDDDEEDEQKTTGDNSDEMSSLTDELPPEASASASSGGSKKTAAALVAANTKENVLIPWAEAKACYESYPCPKCLGKDNSSDAESCLWKPSLEAECYNQGALSDIVVRCKVCAHEKVVCPSIVKSNEDDDNSAIPTTRSASVGKYKSWKSRFREYSVNYNMVILSQVLGCGTDCIGTIFAFFGIAAGKGCHVKWKTLEDEVGAAEQELSIEICTENRQKCVSAYQAKAKEQYTGWLDTGEGRQSTREMKVAKMQQLLNLKDGRIGITVGMDGAWQRRAIGFGNGNSMSGHNFCVDLVTKKIVNAVVYSKQCTTCQRHKKTDTPPPPHRCSANFEGSSKSMEADGSIQHKVDIETKETGIYIHTLCTDDDSSVRANTKYSHDDIARRDYPEYHGRNKHITDWPYTEATVNGKTTRTYAKDSGHLPLQCYSIHRYITDKNHRVRCIGKFLFSKDLQSKAKTTPMGKMSKEEALKLKKYAGYYLKQDINQQLPFDEFVRRAPCMYLHHFNDHSLCNVQWCKILQSQRVDGIQPTVIPVGYMKRFRHKETDKKLLEKLQELYAPYLSSQSLWQCYHEHDTNKNESLNRKCTAVAPKDRYLSGTMSLQDRISFVVVTDSVGYVEAFKRLLLKLGLDCELAAPVLLEWCRRLDNRQTKAGVWRKQPAVKKRRVAAINEAIKAWTVGDKKAALQGKVYQSGSAIDIEACIDSVLESANNTL